MGDMATLTQTILLEFSLNLLYMRQKALQKQDILTASMLYGITLCKAKQFMQDRSVQRSYGLYQSLQQYSTVVRNVRPLLMLDAL